MPGNRAFLIWDKMRGRPDVKITVRLDKTDTVDLCCGDDYPDRAHCGRPKVLKVLRAAEVYTYGGGWKPYPTVTRLKGVEEPGQLVTKVAILDQEGNISVVRTHNGAPDEMLLAAAEKAGLYVEYLDGC